MSVLDGLEYDEGAGSGELDLDDYLREQVAKQKAAPDSATAPTQPVKAPQDETAEDILTGLAAPDSDTPDVQAGLTFEKVGKSEPAPRQPKPLDPNTQAWIEWGRRERDKEEQDKRELAARRYVEARENAMDEADEIAAAMRLRVESPELFAELVESMDDQALEEADNLEDGEFDELYPDGMLPGQKLDEVLQQVEAEQRVAVADAKVQALQEYIDEQRRQAVTGFYEGQGVTGEDRVRAWAEDVQLLRDIGIEVHTASPDEITAGLKTIQISKEEFDREVRQQQFIQQLWDEPTGDINDGLEVQTANGDWVSVNQRPDLRHSDNLPKRIVARARAANDPKANLTPKQRDAALQAEMLSPEATDWTQPGAFTDDKGNPIDPLGDIDRERQRKRDEEDERKFGFRR